jgi:hypothetical protein
VFILKEICKIVIVHVLILRMTIFFRMVLYLKIICFIYKGYIPGLKGQITTTDTVYSCVVYPADISEGRFYVTQNIDLSQPFLQILVQNTKICKYILQ